MNVNNSLLLISSFRERLGQILEAYQLCLKYTSNPYLPLHFREEGLKWLPWYREALILEIETVKKILLEEMEKEEGLSCQE
jgi:hypothetical protein